MNQALKKEKSRAVFYSLLSLILLLSFVRYSLQVNIPRGLLALLAVFIACVGDRDEILAVCICCMPLQECLDMYYTLGFCVILYVVKFSEDIRLDKTIVPILLIFLWELIHCLGEPFNPQSFFTIFVPYILMIVVMCRGGENCDYGFVARALAFTTAIMCLSLLGQLLIINHFNIAATISGLQRLGMTSDEARKSLAIQGGEMNPNTLGILCVLAMTGLFQLRLTGQGKKNDMILAALLLVFGTLTSSRTYLVCLALMVLFLLFGQKGSLSSKIKFFFAVIVVVAVAFLVLNLIFPELLAYYYSRFQVEDITTGRADLLPLYNRFLLSDYRHLLYGVGLQNFGNKMVNIYRVANNTPHNGIQEILLAWGIPGLILFVALLIVLIQRSGRSGRKVGLLNYIPLLIILAKIQVGQMIASGYTMIAFSYAYLSLCQDFSGEEQIFPDGAPSNTIPVHESGGIRT